MSQEARAKMSASKRGKPSKMKGFKHSEETKKKISLKVKDLWKNGILNSKPPSFKEHHLSEEAKEKLRKIHLGTKLSEETKTKIRLHHHHLSGSNHPTWKGDNALPESGRDRANRLFSCPKGFQRHHIDGNPLNNDPSNIKIVTPKEHLTIDGRINNLNRKGRPKKCQN